MTQKSLYFLIEGGSLLDLVRQHIAAHQETNKSNVAILLELGVERYWPSMTKGTVGSVVFPGPRNADFTKPNSKGASIPRKGTEWHRRFADQVGYDVMGYDLAETLGIPTNIQYRKGDDIRGGSSIGGGFTSGVGFLYMSPDGPYALYIPDVAAIVADYEARGYTVDDVCKNFKPEFDGSRPILKEEWDLLVAEHDLAEARAAQ